MDYIKLIGGLILLVLSGDFLVKGGVAVAKKFKVSTLVVGMTVVAFGTSAPEFIVSLQAALNGNSEIAVGNVVGSNIANIGLILGLTALVSPLIVARNSIKIDWPIMMLSTLLFFVAAMDGTVTRIEGIIGFCALLVFVVWQIKTSRNNNQDNETESNEKQLKMWLAAIFIIGSCFGLAFGARILIEGASNIAKSFGVSERVIGITDRKSVVCGESVG